jgi:Spy/CpxP family protein refolding chaperone
MKAIWKTGLVALAGVMLMASSGNAEACRRGHGKKRHGKRACGKMLMRAPSWVLKKKVGLTDAQIAKLKVLRTSTKKQIIPLRAKIKLLRVTMKDLLDTKPVDQTKVLALVKQMHALRGQAKLIKVKAKLTIGAMLTPEQKMKLRKKCRKMFRKRRFRRFRRYGFKHRFGRKGRRGHWGKKRGMHKKHL